MSNTVIYKKYHYTYWITNTKHQKHYIDVRSSKNNPSKDLGLKYFSSSLDEDFMEDQKDNPQDYEYLVIGVFTSRKIASLNEVELHNTYDVAINPRFYNRSKSTSTGFDRSGTIVTEETRKKMSVAKKNMTDETRKKMSDAGKNRPPVTEETRKNMSVCRLGKKRGNYKLKS